MCLTQYSVTLSKYSATVEGHRGKTKSAIDLRCTVLETKYDEPGDVTGQDGIAVGRGYSSLESDELLDFTSPHFLYGVLYRSVSIGKETSICRFTPGVS